MIPIYLEMKAFGPYAGTEIVDFRRLKDHKLFLIYGPTGSGKTTILDAICYALYGSTSGDVRIFSLCHRPEILPSLPQSGTADCQEKRRRLEEGLSSGCFV